MKKIALLLMTIYLAFFTIGCAKCISTDYKNVEVRIVDEYYRGARVIPVSTGKTISMMCYPAIYRIRVEYNGDEYVISGRATYEKYSDKVGETVVGYLRVRNYDDGTTKSDIIGLGDKEVKTWKD